MTVINMISLGEGGLAVADEQSSAGIRKYNVAQKLKVLNNSAVYGGSGPADSLGEVYDAVSREIIKLKKSKDKIELYEIANITEKVLIYHKRNLKDKALLSNLGIGIDEYLTGTLARTSQRLDDSVMKIAGSICSQIDERYSTSILLGGIIDNRFEIYSTDTSIGSTKLSRPYGSIGSGADESDKILSRYVSSLPREVRESIDKQEGLIKIIEATNASSNLNMGVGGSPSIVYVSKEGILRPNESQSILASEIVEGYTRGLLDKDFAYNNVANLVYTNGDVELIEEEMKKKSSDWKKLDSILRGYK